MAPTPSGKGRGRPPKAGGAATPSGRPRGRPRKSDGAAEVAEASEPAPVKPATPSERPKGRPGRPRKGEEAPKPPPLATTRKLRERVPKVVEPSKQAVPAKRAKPSGRRGRPPKVEVQVAKPASTGRPRGRPPKAGTTAKPKPTATTGRVTKSTPKTTKTSKPFEIFDSAIGSYDVTCAEISGNWGEEDDTYLLDITKYDGGQGLIASFNFNIIEGTMLLAKSQAGLNLLVGNAAAEDGLEDGSGEDDDAETEAPKPERGRPAKAKTGDTKQSRRLLLQWRGRDTSEGQVHYDNTSNTGYIEFTNDECSRFKGVASFPAVGEKVAFEGIRVGDDPGDNVTPWNEFSEEAYDKANKARWG